MAVVNTTTYLYVDASLTQHYVQGSALIDRGPWSSSVFYNPPDVIQIGVDQYIAIQANSNTPPTSIVDDNWSTLVVVEEAGSTFSAGSDWYARYTAEQALQTAWVGTAIGSAAYSFASEAYVLAQTGTNLIIVETGSRIAADAALTVLIGSLASDFAIADGTLSAQIAAEVVARTLADSAEASTRLAADGTEAGTRSWADQELWNALYAETGSRIASDGSVVAFVFGSIAVDLAAETGSRIAADLTLTWAGTNESTSRIAGDQQIITIVETGTNTANSAWALAQLGTIVPPLSTLPDVSIPAPVNNQVLGYNGSVWVAMDTPSQVAPGAFTLYLEDTPSGTAGYDLLLSNPSGLPEDFDSVVVGGTATFVPTDAYISNAVQRTLLNGGIWEFNTYASVSNGAQSAQIVVELYTRSIAGVETFLFSGTSDAVSSTSTVLSSLITTQGSYVTALTDKLVAKYYWLRNSSPAVTATIYHSGSVHASHIHTPVGFAHNDLGGLQGGSTNQFYHVTLDQNNALVGNSGYPSASNRYVTEAGLSYASGTLSADAASAYAYASQAYYVAQSGSNTANFAYYLAQVGTNTGSYAVAYAVPAYSIAISGSNTANNAWTLAQQLSAILGVKFSGTINLYTAQVRYGKPDTAFTIIDGILAGRQESKFIWEDFDSYSTTSGTTPVSGMGDGSSWNGYGSIYTNNLITGVNGTDWANLYATGTTSTFSQGTGWAASGTSWGDVYWFRFLGVDNFESYGTGTLSSSGTEINLGSGWVGTAQCYSGSNRP